MADITTLIQKERDRLVASRDEVHARLKAVQAEIDTIDAEIKRADAYLNPAAKRTNGTGTRSPRDGSRRQAVLDIINKTPDGIGPIAIIEQMGLRGDKKGETAVRAMLFQLKKGKVIGTAKKGMYTPL